MANLPPSGDPYFGSPSMGYPPMMGSKVRLISFTKLVSSLKWFMFLNNALLLNHYYIENVILSLWLNKLVWGLIHDN